MDTKRGIRALATGLLVLASVGASGLSARADEHVWVGGSSSGGGWNEASNWKDGSIPSAGDVVSFDFGEGTGGTVVVNDADAALFCSLERVNLNAWNPASGVSHVVVLDVSTNVMVGCALTGVGLFVKRGVGEAELASTWKASNYYEYNRYRVYDVGGGGLSVEEGTLVLPQNRGMLYLWNRVPLHIAKGATVVTSVEDDGNTQLYQLTGEGTLMNRSETLRAVCIGRGWTAQPSMAVFAGKVTGPLQVLVYGQQGFIGNESDTTSSSWAPSFMSYFGEDSDNPARGVLGIGHFGKSGSPSSVGVARSVGCFFGGGLRYLGTGETTDRVIDVDTRLSTPIIFDGGAAGGLRLEGMVAWSDWGANADSRWLTRFILTGSNAAPCTIAGPYNMSFESALVNGGSEKKPFSHYTVKKGTGTWRFEANANTTYRGAFDVQEGTLQFNSLAGKGQPCALGTADLLTDGVISKWDEARFCDIAIRLGGGKSPAARPTLEYVGTAIGVSRDRKTVLDGDAGLRASGETDAAAFVLGDVTALASVGPAEKTLTLDGANVGGNTLRDFAEEEGTRLSIVKDGAGTWMLAGTKAFTGDLRVKGGRLVVRHGAVYRYFKIAFTDGYKHPNGIYILEFALYDKEGHRLNRGLTYAKPDNVSWGAPYTPKDVAASLAPSTLAWDSYNGKAYAAYTYKEDWNRLENLCDGTTAPAQFFGGFPEGDSSYRGVISMRLADNAPEVAYMDFCQGTGQYQCEGSDKYQTASAFVLQGSVDGLTWKTLVEQSGLPINKTGTDWYYSAQKLKVNAHPDERALGEGEGLALTTRAVEDEPSGAVLENVRTVEVAPGATLEYSGIGRKTIRRLTIDATTGAGAIRGFDFADDIVIDVVNVPKGGSVVSVDFSGVGNIGSVMPTFTQDGGSPKSSFTLTEGQLMSRPFGLMLIVK